MFMCSIDDNPATKYEGASDYNAASAILPTPAHLAQPTSDEIGFNVQYGSRQVEALGGCLMLLKATQDQEPDTMGNNAILRYIAMEDVLDEGAAKNKYDLVSVIPLRHALKAQIPKGSFGLFHVSGTMIENTKPVYMVEKVFKPIGDMTLEQAEQSFRSEILAAQSIVAKRRALKRERSHIDPSLEAELLNTVFTPDKKTKRTCADLTSPPMRSSEDA